MAQLVKNPPAMQETPVQFLGWEDPWRKERLPIPALWPRESHGLYSPRGHRVVGHERVALSLVKKTQQSETNMQLI